MKKYLGVKVIQAEKCWGLDNKCVGANSEHCGREIDGYKVVYEDGYTSWSPKDVFEKAYREVVDFDFLKQIDVYPSGDWNFISVDNYQGDCCDDCCESIN